MRDGNADLWRGPETVANKDMRKQLDQAVWRRDEIRLTMCSPGQRIYTDQDLAEAEDDVSTARARFQKMLNKEGA